MQSTEGRLGLVLWLGLAGEMENLQNGWPLREWLLKSYQIASSWRRSGEAARALEGSELLSG